MRLIIRKNPRVSNTMGVIVSCNCLLQTDRIGGRGNRPVYKEMGYVRDATESLALYNDPANHITERYPFPYEGAAEASADRERTLTVLGELDRHDMAWTDPDRLGG